MIKKNKVLTKQEKINHIFNIVINGKDLSKIDIKNLSNYSMSTVLNAIESLKSEGLINEEISNSNSSGRPPYAINVNKSYGIIIGVEFSSSSVNSVAINLARDIIANNTILLNTSPSSSEVLHSIIQIIEKTIADIKEISVNVLGIGIGVPGIIDKKNQTVSDYKYIKDWTNIALKSYVQKHYNLPVFLENNVNSIALGLKWVENEGVTEDLVLIAIRSGVKIALIHNKELVKGRDGLAGEIGKLIIPFASLNLSKSFLDYYKDESLTYEKAISVIGIKNLIISHKNKGLFPTIDLDSKNSIIDMIIEGYIKGDKDCSELYLSIMEIIASLVFTIEKIINPKKIIIATEYCIYENFDNDLKKIVKIKYNMDLEIESMVYSNPLGAVGASSIVLEKLYKF